MCSTSSLAPHMLAAVEAASGLSVLLSLFVSIAFIIIAIAVLRVHPFLALIVAALLAGWLSARTAEDFLDTVDLVAEGFGATAGSIGIVIALAAIIGACLTESGAADTIVRRSIKVFGEKRAGWALMFSGFFLAIPVFFDTVFYLLIPLARTLGIRLKRNYLYFVLAIGAGGAITHSVVPPTPGPLLVAEAMNLPLGMVMVTGLFAGIVPAVVALYFSRWIDSRMPLPVRPVSGGDLENLERAVQKPDAELPSLTLSVLPIVVPLVLLSGAAILGVVEGSLTESERSTWFPVALVSPVAQFLGHKVIALGAGALIAMATVAKQSRMHWREIGQRLTAPLESAAIIILITAAGGAFGAMLRHTGVGDHISIAANRFNIDLVLLAWGATALIRMAQGSATVAMITGSSIMTAILASGVQLDYHPIYIYLAIGFGSFICSWMNDSGFWIITKLSGMTEREALRSWTVMLTLMSIVGLIETLILSRILPLTGW